MLEDTLPGVKVLEAHSAVYSIDVPPDNVFDPMLEVLVQLELLICGKLLVADLADVLFAQHRLRCTCDICFCLSNAGTDTYVDACFCCCCNELGMELSQRGPLLMTENGDSGCFADDGCPAAGLYLPKERIPFGDSVGMRQFGTCRGQNCATMLSPYRSI